MMCATCRNGCHWRIVISSRRPTARRLAVTTRAERWGAGSQSAAGRAPARAAGAAAVRAGRAETRTRPRRRRDAGRQRYRLRPTWVPGLPVPGSRAKRDVEMAPVAVHEQQGRRSGMALLDGALEVDGLHGLTIDLGDHVAGLHARVG